MSKAIVKEVKSTQPRRYAAMAIIDTETTQELFRAQHEHNSAQAADAAERAIVSWERANPAYEVEWRI
jgi:hypothetical protein